MNRVQIAFSHLRRAGVLIVAVGIAPACLLCGARAQETVSDPWSSPDISSTQPYDWGEGDIGRTAETGAGEVGQRQTVRDLGAIARPVRRVENRIQNRVQSRLRNRIDRYYDPTANAQKPFEVASDQARQADQSR